MAIEKFDCRLKSTEMITPSVRQCVFERVDGKAMSFIPGQFITLLLRNEVGELKRRSYSIATVPGRSEDIEIVLSYIPGGVASEKLFHMAVGDVVEAMGPVGRLIMQEEDVRRYILVGTGTGIAPYRAMIPDLLQRMRANSQFETVILEGVQSREDLLYARDFLEMTKQEPRASYLACFSRQAPEASYERRGYVQNQFDALQLNPAQDVVFLCGNPNMVDQAFEKLTKMGFPSASIRREKYISSN